MEWLSILKEMLRLLFLLYENVKGIDKNIVNVKLITVNILNQ